MFGNINQGQTIFTLVECGNLYCQSLDSINYSSLQVYACGSLYFRFCDYLWCVAWYTADTCAWYSDTISSYNMTRIAVRSSSTRAAGNMVIVKLARLSWVSIVWYLIIVFFQYLGVCHANTAAIIKSALLCEGQLMSIHLWFNSSSLLLSYFSISTTRNECHICSDKNI